MLAMNSPVSGCAADLGNPVQAFTRYIRRYLVAALKLTERHVQPVAGDIVTHSPILMVAE